MNLLAHRHVAVAAGVMTCLLAAATTASAQRKSDGHRKGDRHPPSKYIVLERQGWFAAGGQVIGNPDSASLSCDHGHVEYQIPPDPREISLFMWHSAGVGAWMNRWDGGEGFQSIFLRRGYPVYLWDGPRVGRSNWGCEGYEYAPRIGADQGNFDAWRFGIFPNWFPGVQFPVDDPEAFNQAMRSRYQEFDIQANAQLETDAAAVAVDSIGPVVLLTNSAGGMRGLLTAMKSRKGNVKGIVAYENVGWVFPEDEGPPGSPGGFGPIKVPREEFLKLTKIPMQFVWGDNVEHRASYVNALEMNRQFVELVNKYGGKAEILMLEDAGLVGSTHIPFADLNNEEVADLLSDWLHEHGLDKWTRKGKKGHRGRKGR